MVLNNVQRIRHTLGEERKKMLADERKYQEPHKIPYYTLPFGKVSKAVKRYGKQVIEEPEKNLNDSFDGEHNNGSHLHKVDRKPGRQMIQGRQIAWDKRTADILGMKSSYTVSKRKCQDGEKEVSVLDLPPMSNDLPHPNKLFRRKRSANRPYQKEKENHGIESHLRQLMGKQARCVNEDKHSGSKQQHLDEEWKGQANKAEVGSMPALVFSLKSHHTNDLNETSRNIFGQSNHYVTGLINNSSMWIEGGSYIESVDNVTLWHKPHNLWNNQSKFEAKEE